MPPPGATTVCSLGQPYASLPADARFSAPARTITEADVAAFAALTGDHHPQHVDAEWAACSPFGQRIAHGMLTVSFALGMVALDPLWIVAVRRLDDVVFKAPVAIGDTIAVEGRIAGRRAIGDELGLVATRWRIANQHDRTVVRFCLELLWRAALPAAAVRPIAKETT